MVTNSAVVVIATRDAYPEETAHDSIRENPVEVDDDVDTYIKRPSLLYQLIVKNSWDAVIERCKSHPNETKHWLVHEDEASWRRLPLHEACIRRASADVIDALLEANPEAAKALDHNLRLPIHHACFYGCSQQAVRKLLCANAEGLSVKDTFDKLPIKIAHSSSSKNKSEIINLLSKDPLQVMFEEYRCKWEKEMEPTISKLHADFEAERAKYEAKIQSFSEGINEQWCRYDNQCRSLKNTDHLDLIIQEHKLEKKKIMEKNESFLERQRDCYEEQIEALKKEDECILSRLNKAETDVSELIERLNVAAKSEEQLKHELELLEAKLQEQTSSCDELSQINTELQIDLAKSNIQALSVINKLNSTMEHGEAMSSELNSLKIQLNSEKLTSKKLNLMIDTCRAENQSLMEQLNAHREGVTTMLLRADFYKNQKKTNEEIDFEQFAKLMEDKGMLTARAEELKQLITKKESDMKLAEENLGILMQKNEAMCQEFQKQLLNVEDSKEKLVESHEVEKQNLIGCVINLTTQLEALKSMEEKLQNDLTINEK